MSALGKFFRVVAAVLVAASVPAFLWMGVARARRYAELRESIVELEAKQRGLVDDNKRLISDIAAYESPERIEELANGELGLEKVGPEDVLRVELGHD